MFLFRPQHTKAVKMVFAAPLLMLALKGSARKIKFVVCCKKAHELMLPVEIISMLHNALSLPSS